MLIYHYVRTCMYTFVQVYEHVGFMKLRIFTVQENTETYDTNLYPIQCATAYVLSREACLR